MRRHCADPISLVFGLVFAGAGGILLADRLDLLTQVRWLTPLLLIVVALGLFASATWSLRRDRTSGGPGG